MQSREAAASWIEAGSGIGSDAHYTTGTMPRVFRIAEAVLALEQERGIGLTKLLPVVS